MRQLFRSSKSSKSASPATKIVTSVLEGLGKPGISAGKRHSVFGSMSTVRTSLGSAKLASTRFPNLISARRGRFSRRVTSTAAGALVLQ